MNIKTAKTRSVRSLFGNEYLSSLCYELAMLFKAGIPAADGMEMLSADESDRAAAAKLKIAADRLRAGALFSESLEAADAFPQYMIDMLHIGEVTGRLETALSSLSLYYESRGRLTRTIRYALFYPGMLGVLMLAVALILITQVLPVFGDISLQLGVELSGTAETLIETGRFITKHSFWIIPAAVAFFAAVTLLVIGLYRRGPVGKSIFAARFASAMSMGMSSGLEIDQSLMLAERLCSDSSTCRSITLSREAMRRGETFPDAISQMKIFEELYNRMLAVGFRSGAADAAMAEIARRYEELAAERTEAAAGRLEPTLVIAMALLVGFILLSVMLPLMTIMSSL